MLACYKFQIRVSVLSLFKCLSLFPNKCVCFCLTCYLFAGLEEIPVTLLVGLEDWKMRFNFRKTSFTNDRLCIPHTMNYKCPVSHFPCHQMLRESASNTKGKDKAEQVNQTQSYNFRNTRPTQIFRFTN